MDYKKYSVLRVSQLFPTRSPHNKINIKTRQHQKAIRFHNKSATSPSLGFAEFILFPF